MKRSLSSRRGFTLTEVLIVVAVLAVLFIILLLNFNSHQGRARDAGRKTDLEKIKIAFEEYYNDHGCYPPSDILNNCNGQELQPYLDRIPCDPFTKEPYVYVPLEDNECKGYRVLAHLENTEDPAIGQSGCESSCGCGFGAEYQYGISSGVTLKQTVCTPINPPASSPSPATSPGGGTSPSPGSGGGSPSPSTSSPPSPSVTPMPGTYACDPAGACNLYENPSAAGCDITFNDQYCENMCYRVDYRCDF
jgi:prepilin-type N-terminal cleavage/methylation domain-containing protein